MILLDTHTLLWWCFAPSRLSARAARVCEEMHERGGLVSAISMWEIAAKLRRGRLELSIPASQLAERLEREAVVRFLPVDVPTWLRTAELDWEHRDPADRVIVATAMIAGVPILTKDALMHAQKHVECIW